MKVVLNSDVEKLGRRGDIVDVAAGYARNFLLPRKLAIFATKGSLKQAEAMLRSRDEKDRKERTVFEEIAGRIGSTPLVIKARAGAEGQLFGSITNADIAEELEKVLGQPIDRRKVVLADPIKSLGTHQFAVNLASDVTATGTLEVTGDGAPVEVTEGGTTE